MASYQELQARALAAGLSVSAGSLGAAPPAQVCAGEEFADIRPGELSEGPAPVDSLVCSFEEGEVVMTTALMRRVLHARRLLGRPLGLADLQALDRAEGAVDDNA